MNNIKYFFEKLICFFIGHDWYIVDYFYGLENNNVWNIKSCDRCRKSELD